MLSIGSFAAKIFGSSNERRVKGFRPRVEAINALEPELVALTDEQLRARTAKFREQYATGTKLEDLLVPGLRHRTRSGQALARAAPLRRAAHRRHGSERRQHCRDEDRRRQDARRNARRLPQRHYGQGRPRRHRQRLPRQPRRRMDGTGLPLPRPHGGHHRSWPRRRAAQGRLRRRRDLRHQQRARLRLPARQHEDALGGYGPARPRVRHRRRGGLDPDRRGKNPASHSGPLEHLATSTRRRRDRAELYEHDRVETELRNPSRRTRSRRSSRPRTCSSSTRSSARSRSTRGATSAWRRCWLRCRAC